MSRLELKKLRKAYGDTVVLEGIDLDLASGEFCAVVGASGCGKSTLLKMLLGQESPTSGSLLLDGAPLPTEPSPERGIVYQRYSVFRHMTVAENVRFGLELRDGDPVFGLCFGARRRAIRARGAELIDSVGLGHVADRYPSQLSGGMQQRLALAQAIALEPPLLLLDEPFGALDPGNRSAMHDLLRKLWRAAGMTVVMVTHDLAEAFYLGTRVLVLDRPDAGSGIRTPGVGARITYDLPLRRGAVAPTDVADEAPQEPPLMTSTHHD
ncbi:MAG TPA: ATP-binding cassette domain-containing protein [Pseudomonadales bacterium]|nr:ATP-binding cassette domain-containing protein [Pseudomonadales bacterium]